eukprot:6488782-Amphidinium_carterae.2
MPIAAGASLRVLVASNRPYEFPRVSVADPKGDSRQHSQDGELSANEPHTTSAVTASASVRAYERPTRLLATTVKFLSVRGCRTWTVTFALPYPPGGATSVTSVRSGGVAVDASAATIPDKMIAYSIGRHIRSAQTARTSQHVLKGVQSENVVDPSLKEMNALDDSVLSLSMFSLAKFCPSFRQDAVHSFPCTTAANLVIRGTFHQFEKSAVRRGCG